MTLDLSRVTREIRDRYRLFKRPQSRVEFNPAIGSRQPDFKGMRISGSVVVEQLRSGVCRFELVADFPPLSQAALDDAEIQARLPRPQAPGTPAEDADPATGLRARTWELAGEVGWVTEQPKADIPSSPPSKVTRTQLALE